MITSLILHTFAVLQLILLVLAVFHVLASEACSGCLRGAYQTVPGPSTCVRAPAGTFVTSDGQGFHRACVGSYSYLQGMTYCSLCAPGRFHYVAAGV